MLSGVKRIKILKFFRTSNIQLGLDLVLKVSGLTSLPISYQVSFFKRIYKFVQRNYMLLQINYKFAQRNYMLVQINYKFAPRNYMLVQINYKFAQRNYVIAQRNFTHYFFLIFCNFQCSLMRMLYQPFFISQDGIPTEVRIDNHHDAPLQKTNSFFKK